MSFWHWVRRKELNSAEKTHLGRVDRGFIYKQNGNVIFDGIDAMALAALKRFALRNQCRLAGRTNKNFEKFLVNHADILPQTTGGDDRSVPNGASHSGSAAVSHAGRQSQMVYGRIRAS